MLAKPSGPMPTSKKSPNERSLKMPVSPPVLMEPVCMTWSPACVTVNDGSRVLALSDCANIRFHVDVAGISFEPPVNEPGLASLATSGGPTLLDWYHAISTRPASPAAIHGNTDVPMPDETFHGPTKVFPLSCDAANQMSIVVDGVAVPVCNVFGRALF